MANTSIYNAFERMWEHTNNAIDNAIDAIESDILIVTATMDGDTGTASHSASEIKAAYDAGKAITMHIDNQEAYLQDIYDDSVAFRAIDFGLLNSIERDLYVVDDNKTLAVLPVTNYFIPSVNETKNGMFLKANTSKLNKAEWVDLDILTEEEIPNLYVWKKYDGDPSQYRLEEATSPNVGIYIGTSGSRVIYYSDEFNVVDTANGRKVELVNATSVSGTNLENFNVIKGKYAASGNGTVWNVYYVLPDATLTFVDNSGIRIQYAQQVVANESVTDFGYVSSKSFTDYPSSGTHTDGYWYQYIKQLGDSAVVDGSNVNFTETDPTVPAWAKEANKPTYTASEVGALPATTVIPSKLSDLNADSTHRTVTDTEKSTWNAKANKSDIPTVPTKVSAFENDKGYLTQHQSLAGYAKTSDVPTKTSQLTNDSGYITSVPVASVNGKTGAVQLSASDVGAIPNTTVIPSIEGLATETYVDNAVGDALANIGSGSAESDILIVTATMNGNTGTASHSGDEIEEALNAGKVIVLNDNYNFLSAPLYMATMGTAIFFANGVITSNNNIRYTEYRIQSDKTVTLTKFNYNFATIDDVNSAISTAITSAIGGSY